MEGCRCCCCGRRFDERQNHCMKCDADTCDECAGRGGYTFARFPCYCTIPQIVRQHGAVLRVMEAVPEVVLPLS